MFNLLRRRNLEKGSCRVEDQEFCLGFIRFDYSLELRREFGAEM